MIATETGTEIDAELLELWVVERRAILQREGCAVRAGFGHSIEVQIINSPFTAYATLTLPDGRQHFATAELRDRVLRQLQQTDRPPAEFRPLSGPAFVRNGRAHL